VVELSLANGKLHCEVLGLHKFWACKSSLDIPLEHIRGVTIRSEETQKWWHGWKVLGTDMPGLIAAGLFAVNGKWVFWDIVHPENAIEIDLAYETYDRLLIEVPDPQGATNLIESALENLHML
jgi:hypothetical protein